MHELCQNNLFLATLEQCCGRIHPLLVNTRLGHHYLSDLLKKENNDLSCHSHLANYIKIQ